jgi:hypothetical protein
MRLERIFSTKKPVIGVLHLDYLEGQSEYRGWGYLISRAQSDFYNLQDGGIDGVLIENWKEDTVGIRANPENVECMRCVCQYLPPIAKVPLGINVLNNDYQASFDIAKDIGAKFVQLDVFVDHVQTEFDFSPSAKEHPFEIKPSPKEIIDYRKEIGAEDIALLTFIQPKHYKMLERKSIETSAKQAIENGADALIVTGKRTGTAPTFDNIIRAKKVAKDVPVGLGSGFSRKNAKDFLPLIDFAIVGTDLKYENNTDNPVDIERVKELMKIIQEMR